MHEIIIEITRLLQTAEALPALASYHFRTHRHDGQGHDTALYSQSLLSMVSVHPCHLMNPAAGSCAVRDLMRSVSTRPTKQVENPPPSSRGITSSATASTSTAATATATSWPVIRASALCTADHRVSALGAPESWGCRWQASWYCRHFGSLLWAVRHFGRALPLLILSVGLLLRLPLLLGRLLGHSIQDRDWAGCSRTILLPPCLHENSTKTSRQGTRQRQPQQTRYPSGQPAASSERTGSLGDAHLGTEGAGRGPWSHSVVLLSL